jgi:hypothetical protein
MNPTNKTKLSALAALFVAFPRQEREGTEKQLLEVYLMAVEDIDHGFFALACKRFIQGQVMRPNLTFRPTPPELAVEARRLRDKALDHDRLSNLRLAAPESSDPPDPTPEERQRCAEMWARTKAEIDEAVKALRPPRKGSAPSPPDYTPRFDISDLPDANASWAEVKAWEERQKDSAA